MTQQVRLTQSIDDREVVQAFQRQNQLLDKLERKMDSLGTKGQRAGKQTGGSFGEARKEMERFATGIVGIGAVIGGIATATAAIKREYDELLKRQRLAATTTQNASQAVRAARINFTPDATLKDADLERTVKELATDTRSPVGVVGAALSTAFSAKGSLDNAVAVEAVRQSLRVTPGDPGAASTTAGRILDIAKISDTKDPRAIAGFLLNVQGASRVTSLDKVGATAIPAITSLAARGDTPEQAAELFAAFTQGLADEEGRTSATSLKTLGTRLGDFVPTERGKDKRGRFAVPQSQIAAFEAARSTSQRIGVLQKSPELRRSFLGQTSFEAGAQAFIEQLVSGDPQAQNELNKARASIQAITPDQAKRFEKKVGSLEGGAFQPVQTTTEASDTNIENYELGSVDDARAGTTREVFRKTLETLDLEGFDYPSRKVKLSGFDAAVAAGRDPESVAIGVLETLLKPSGGLASSQHGDAPRAEEQQLLRDQISILREQLSAYEQMNESIKENTDAVKNQNAGGERARREPAAAANRRGGQ